MDSSKKKYYDELIDEFNYVNYKLTDKQLDGEIFNSFETSTVAAILVATNSIADIAVEIYNSNN